MDQIDRAIKESGGLVAVSARLKGMGAEVSVQRLSNWTTRGVPIEYMRLLEEATENRVRCWDVFPGTWHRIWPELIGTAGAPPAPEGEQARVA